MNKKSRNVGRVGIAEILVNSFDESDNLFFSPLSYDGQILWNVQNLSPVICKCV